LELSDNHLEVIRTAALAIEYGSITIHAGTGDHLNITIESRLRLPIEQPENELKTERKKPRVIARHVAK